MKYFRLSNLMQCGLVMLLFVFAQSCRDNNDPGGTLEVTAIDPSSGPAGAVVTITGKFFSGVPADNHVEFNGKEAVVSEANSNELKVVVPPDATTGPVAVTVNGQQASNQPVFTIGEVPAIVTSITPMSGGYNTIVTITGLNFRSASESNVVTFNGVPAEVQNASATSLIVKVPVRSGTGVVGVNGTNSDISFAYYPDVFIVGYEVIGTIASAKLWKNGVPTVLSKADEFATGLGITVLNDDVHIVGYSLVGGYTIAKYWKNFADTSLPGSEHSSTANSVSFNGDDVYEVGSHTKTGDVNIASYWVNGSLVEVEDNGFPSYAQAHAIAGTDIYLAGGEFVDGAYRATYWKNGKAYRVSDEPSFINGIAVKGDDIHLVGYEQPSKTSKFATYWKNDETFHLTAGLNQGEASAIRIVGRNVYITGQEQNAEHIFVARYWKNGVETLLSNGLQPCYATSIDVVGNDVYIIGAEHNGINASIAKFWKNGSPTDLTDGRRNAFAYGIYLR